ncbi:hypothetical protein [Anaeromassilibacillus sp. SJQ-1]|uniref:hypothetical protein n=1 Tax=Anaeromassilibacillus sp. SJQ-1 TaxID=3375419 RepID=UPI0039895D27
MTKKANGSSVQGKDITGDKRRIIAIVEGGQSTASILRRITETGGPFSTVMAAEKTRRCRWISGRG